MTTPKSAEYIRKLELSLDELICIYKSLIPSTKLEFLDAIWNQRQLAKAKCLDFLIYVIKTEESLKLMAKACSYVEQEAGLSKNILSADDYVNWWSKSKHKYEAIAGVS